MSDFRVLENLVFDSTTAISSSSEDSSFPDKNMNKFIRGRVWKSNLDGNFVIDSTNNKLDFNEGAAELNATITSATYTASSLATEDQEPQLDATGGDVYTVSYNQADGKWTISSDGATLNLLWNTGTNTANTIGDTIGFDTTADDTGATSYESDNVAIHTEETLTFDLASARDVDSVAVLFDAKRGSQLSGSAVVKIQANATDSWASPSVDQTLTFDSTIGIYTFNWSSSQSYRYWRLQIVNPTNTNLQVEIGKVFLGQKLGLSQAPDNGFKLSVDDLSRVTVNDYGNQFVDIFPKRKTIELQYKFLTQTDIELLLDLYDRVGKSEPIGILFDANETIFDKDRYFFYGTFTGSFQQQHVFYNISDTAFTITEAL